jgi:hypothetical protein
MEQPQKRRTKHVASHKMARKAGFWIGKEGDLSDFNIGHCNLCISRSLPEM